MSKKSSTSLVFNRKVGELKKLFFVETVAKKYKMPLHKAFRIMHYAKKNYQIPYERFAVRNLMKNPTDASFEKEQALMEKISRRQMKKISTMTGWSMEKVSAETSRVEEVYGFSVKEYYIYQLYQLSEDELLAFHQKETEEQKANIAPSMPFFAAFFFACANI